MTPDQIRTRRLELGLTICELAWALNIPEDELQKMEEGLSEECRARSFDEAFDCLEERLIGTFCGA